MSPDAGDQLEATASTVDRLARIETKLDLQREDRQAFAARLADQGRRLDRVERFMWLSVGMSLAAGIPQLAAYLQGGTP